MNNGENSKIKPHKIPEKTAKASIHVDLGDHSILKVYQKVLKAPMRGVIHLFIGIAARCLEEKHDEEIKYLKERLRFQAFIIVLYIEKYGQLRAKDR